MNRNILHVIAVGICIVFWSLNTQAQELSKYDKRPWTFNPNFGQTLFWGDGNNDIVNPFGAYFQNDKSAFGYGIIIQKNFNPWLGLDFQYLGGQLKGTRYTWSNEAPANLYFATNMNHFGLNFNIDVLDILMAPKTDRLFNFYVRGGGAYNLFDAKEYNLLTDVLIASKKEGAVQLVGGWGVRFDLTKSIGITFENIFSYSLSDYLDARSTSYSQASDIYAYTSLGLAYRIYPKPRKPRLDNDTDNSDITDITVADNNSNDNSNDDDDNNNNDDSQNQTPAPELSINVSLPSQILGSDTVLVKFSIQKHQLSESAKLQQTLPMGFSAVENSAGFAKFSFSDQIVSFSWNALPDDKETVTVSYFLISNQVIPANYSLPGIIFYNENGAESIKQFKETIEVVKPEPVIAQNDNQDDSSNNNNQQNQQNQDNQQTVNSNNQNQASQNDISSNDTQGDSDNQTQNNQQSNAQNPKVEPPVSAPSGTGVDGLEYRVQVKAIYGGSSDKKAIARQYRLSEDVSEEVAGSYTKYTAGHFKTYAEAQAYKMQLREGRVPGAFVVAYNNGQRMSDITKAIKMEGKPVSSPSQTKSNPVNNISGVSYSIQVAASSKNIATGNMQSQLGLMHEEIVKTTHNGLYKYLIGSYTSKQEANQALSRIRQTVEDAFLVQFINGERK